MHGSKYVLDENGFYIFHHFKGRIKMKVYRVHRTKFT